MNAEMKLALQELDSLISRKGFAYALCMTQIEDEAIDTRLIHKRNNMERLSSNELVFLWSLLINKEDIWQYPESVDAMYDMRCEIHWQMDALHFSFFAGIKEQVQEMISGTSVREYKSSYDGSTFQEAIFYSGGGLYDEEYLYHVKNRYADDAQWLKEYKEYEADAFCDIACKIKKATSEKIRRFRLLSLPETLEERMANKPSYLSYGDYQKVLALGQFLYSQDDSRSMEEYCDRIRDALSFSVENLSGQTSVDSYLRVFGMKPEKDCNSNCKEPGDYSILMSSPIIYTGDGQWLLTEVHQLFKSLYDVPGYWLKERLDESKAVGSRTGDYSERETMKILKRVFGEDCYSDIIVKKGKNTVTDIDALCVWRDYAICFQIKSKGLTLASRRGNIEAIRSDFTKSFQAAYNQGLKCRNALLAPAGYKFVDKDNGMEIELPKVKEAFVVCETSDEYPSLTHQMAVMLQRKEGEPEALAINLFDLDMMGRYLDKPYYFVHYVHNRLKYYAATRSDVEANCLSAYMVNRLYLNGGDYDFFMFDNSFAKSIDAELLPQYERQKEVSVDNSTWRDATFDELLKGIDATTDNIVAPFILELLNLAKNEVMEVGEKIRQQLNETDRDRVSCSSFCKDELGFSFVAMPMKGKREVHDLMKSVCLKEAQDRKTANWFTIAHFQGSDTLVGSLVGMNAKS